MIALRVVAGVTNHFIQRLPEWANATILTMFGMTLLQSGDTFSSSPSYLIMAQYASEDAWGWGLVLIGGVRLTALMLNGTFPWFARWSLRIRATSASLCCFAWFSLAAGFYLSNTGSTGSKTYAGLLAVDVILAIFLGGQAGKADRGLWNGRA